MAQHKQSFTGHGLAHLQYILATVIKRGLNQPNGEHRMTAATFLVELGLCNTTLLLTLIKHLKCFLCALHFDLSGTNYKHIVTGVLTEKARGWGPYVGEKLIVTWTELPVIFSDILLFDWIDLLLFKEVIHIIVVDFNIRHKNWV